MQQAVFAFRLQGSPIRCVSFGCGHINNTFQVETDAGRKYVLQEINTHVFKKPVELMENVTAVTSFLRRRITDPRGVLHFVPACTGKYWHQDEEGRYWRCYEYVSGFCLETPETDEDFYESAVAFGGFQELLRDFPAATLHETIPEFHNTLDRYRLLKEAVAADRCGRATEVAAELDFILHREDEAGTLQRLRESGELPLRVTHNDTKLNNVLLDEKTRKALCVLDLDTVMPGLSLYDYGDSIRFGAATAAEDEQELDRMELDLHRFDVYTQGFTASCPSLTVLERELLPLGAKTMTLEVAVRFLTDYLEGDHYFKTAYPHHNLVRTRTQLKLVGDMEHKWSDMQALVAAGN
ncbi:MAG: aminoglycoside phosphotransferase family protein [Clostridiales bacterium]|nr:aminoglycoside phosphotransferase family protein [Clostridiales bacterium]